MESQPSGGIDNQLRIWETPLEDMPSDILYPFAWEELICRQVGLGQLPMLHIWRHPKAMVVGLRDRRLPRAAKAMEQLRQQGWEVAVRPSGGAAVPLNRGVLNVSLILPNPKRAVNIHDDFRRLAGLISRALIPWTNLAKAGEIEGAFCPGDYDLSIDGRKFCGIAQRRQAKAYIVSAFVIVEGTGDQLAEEVRQFYNEAAGIIEDGPDVPEVDIERPGLSYPQVRPGTMASLQELSTIPSVGAFTESFIKTAQSELGGVLLTDPPEISMEEINKMVETLKQRYDH